MESNGKQRSVLERVLGIFAEVKGGEGGSALLLTLNVFLILTSYYIMKPVREALILAGGGAELKSYMSAGQAFLMLGTVPLYAKLAASLPRRKLLNYVTLFFSGCLVLFYVLAQIQVPLGVIFFLWIGIFNVSVIAQFWSFANDLYTPEQGKRLFAIVAFGGSAGAVFGPKIAGALIEPIGPYQLLLVAGALLSLSLLATNSVESRAKGAVPSATDETAPLPPVEEPMGDANPYKLVFGNSYLLSIALLILFLNWVNTTGEYILGRVVAQAADAAVIAEGVDKATYIGKFYSDFFFIVNIVGLGIQLFLVSRILKYFGVRTALMVLPVIAFAGYAFAAFYPVIGIIRWAKTAENSTDYSLMNTLRGVLFLPTTREEKYKAKQAIDTIFVRAGDVLSALLVFVGTTYLSFTTKHFALVNLGLLVVWILLAIRVGKGYRRLAAERG
jgi:AAA family ATP:ADP antiporter